MVKVKYILCKIFLWILSSYLKSMTDLGLFNLEELF